MCIVCNPVVSGVADHCISSLARLQLSRHLNAKDENSALHGYAARLVCIFKEVLFAGDVLSEVF